MEKITTWINKNNSVIAWAGLIVLPAIAWWINTQWPNAENMIAILAALIGSAPAVFIEFSRRANEIDEKSKKETAAVTNAENLFKLAENILVQQKNGIDSCLDEIKILLAGQRTQVQSIIILAAQRKIKPEECDLIFPDKRTSVSDWELFEMLNLLLETSLQFFSKEEFKEIIKVQLNYKRSQKLLELFAENELKRKYKFPGNDYTARERELYDLKDTFIKTIGEILSIQVFLNDVLSKK